MSSSRLFWENKEPDFVNEKGIKWWIDHSTMEVARLPSKYVIYVIQDKDYITRIVVDNDSGVPIYEAQQLEAVGCFCDVLRTLEKERKDD